MINPIQNAYNYFKYGKVVHKSPNGNVIREKLNYPKFFDVKTGHFSTTKTVLNEKGSIEKQFERTGYISNDCVSTTFRPVLYNKILGEKLAQSRQPRTKNYLVRKDEKILTDNTKPGYDYVYSPLPNGKTQYIIAYPETTIVNKKEGTVITSMDSKKVIV